MVKQKGSCLGCRRTPACFLCYEEVTYMYEEGVHCISLIKNIFPGRTDVRSRPQLQALLP